MTAEAIPHLILASVFGLLIGSFLNVCIYRMPRDMSVVTPRSFCPECGHRIAWHDNIPLLSYLLLKGRCRDCKHAIGIRYPVVELTTALLLVVTVARYGWSGAAAKWSLFEGIMVVLFWTDLEELILPEILTIGGALAGLILAWFVRVPGFAGDLFLFEQNVRWRSLANAGSGALLLSLPIWLLGSVYSKIIKKEALGLGDVLLLALLGTFLGPERGLLATMGGTIGGAVIGGGYILATRQDPRKFEVPFGSFLCAAAAAVPLVWKIG